MTAETLVDDHKARALELAHRGIESGADGDHQTARTAWREALDYAERHVQGDDIVLWISDGLGAVFLRCGDFQAALDMARTAQAFCASHRQPSALLTMTEACLALGDVPSARIYAHQAVYMRGKVVLKRFSPADRDRLGQLE